MSYLDDEILRLELLVQQVERRRSARIINEISALPRQDKCEFAVYLDQFTSTLCGRKVVGSDLETEQARCQKHLS
jgi:hypothetical protein